MTLPIIIILIVVFLFVVLPKLAAWLQKHWNTG
jgi:hypothetical protein